MDYVMHKHGPMIDGRIGVAVRTVFHVCEEPGDGTRYTHIVQFDNKGNVQIEKDLLTNGGAGCSLYLYKGILDEVEIMFKECQTVSEMSMIAHQYFATDGRNPWTVASALRAALHVRKEWL